MTPPSLRALVVDDEPLARQTLVTLLSRESGLETVREAGDGASAVEAVRRERPDLLFLDVQMPELDGFGVLEVAREVGVPAVILVTAFSQHAARAFDEEATDYLVKPFSDARFVRAVQRARSRILAARAEAPAPTEHEVPPGRWLERFAVETHGRIAIVPVQDVQWIEAQDYYVQIYAAGREYLLRESLRKLEAQLDPRAFARIHRSAIVNVRAVQQLRRRTHGEYTLVLAGGAELKLSRTHRDRLQLLLGRR